MTHALLAPTLRLTAAAGLAVVAVVHWRLAPAHDLIGDVLTQGDLFRMQAVAAGVLATSVLARPSAPVWAVAGLLSVLSLLAVVGTTYVAVPAVGPFPRVFEPVWYVEKLLAAGAAALATVSCCLALLLDAAQATGGRRAGSRPAAR